MTTILNAIERNQLCVLVLLDMSKAFDCINHEKLLQKLEQMGIRGHINKWIQSYLSGRKIIVNFNNYLSDEKDINRGTAQGSNLGPLIYILYTNDMLNHVTFAEGILFADDTSLTCCGVKMKTIIAKLKTDLSNLYNYYIENDLSVNLSKTNIMV